VEGARLQQGTARSPLKFGPNCAQRPTLALNSAMNPLLSAVLVLSSFALRDMTLLPRRPRLIFVYTVLMLGFWLAAGLAAEATSREEALRVLASRTVWATAIGVHVALSALAWWCQAKPRALAILALVPAPTFLLAAGGSLWLAMARWNVLSGWSAGGVAWLGWCLAVLAAGQVRRPQGSAGPALSIAVHLTAAFLLPLQGMPAEEPAGAAGPLDWAGAMLPLVVVAGLVLLSFLFHSRRQPRWPGVSR
jgi:hypothetical protein